MSADSVRRQGRAHSSCQETCPNGHHWRCVGIPASEEILLVSVPVLSSFYFKHSFSILVLSIFHETGALRTSRYPSNCSAGGRPWHSHGSSSWLQWLALGQQPHVLNPSSPGNEAGLRQTPAPTSSKRAVFLKGLPGSDLGGRKVYVCCVRFLFLCVQSNNLNAGELWGNVALSNILTLTSTLTGTPCCMVPEARCHRPTVHSIYQQVCALSASQQREAVSDHTNLLCAV